MKNPILCVLAILAAAALIITPTTMSAARTSRHSSRERYTTWPGRRSSAMGRVALTSNGEAREKMKHDGAHPLQIAGSRLPDCSHACGSCTPCVLKIVTSLCSSLSQSEACPISYKCLCNNKYYPVP
ncbi:PROTEIN EPIDERMAL PATTERNING FACTOR 1 [Salix viminalis]|uniref:Epidermal patterning factor-like protein n=1 Tax=Salix viminalis TaxID=40686 RepID=A0A9Q0U6N9_SALVM|nr:PROTEIN EPIDERMAL PATTERNING FACTOR 1 [Salix viminalis]